MDKFFGYNLLEFSKLITEGQRVMILPVWEHCEHEIDEDTAMQLVEWNEPYDADNGESIDEVFQDNRCYKCEGSYSCPFIDIVPGESFVYGAIGENTYGYDFFQAEENKGWLASWRVVGISCTSKNVLRIEVRYVSGCDKYDGIPVTN